LIGGASFVLYSCTI